jgi:ParB/RepB/Spo0J family partition protein
MPIEQIPIEQIEDNPYNPRQTYHKKDIDDMAHSIENVGLLSIPQARRKDGVVQIAFGGIRRRAYEKLAKKNKERWGTMPLDIRDIPDQRMALYAIEENLHRHDITPMELARSVDTYLSQFPELTEEKVAKQLNMTQGNVSHMRRVLKLPDKVLEKINIGRINFTMGRELLVLVNLDDAQELMLEAIRKIRTENSRSYSAESCTVEGMQRAIDSVASYHFRNLEKGAYHYYGATLFDSKKAGCLTCDKVLKTHPAKTQTSNYCTDQKCWEKKQQDHKDQMAAEATAKMQADILQQAAEAEAAAKRKAQESITQVISEPGETYRIHNKTKNDWWEGNAISPSEALGKAGWKQEDCEIKVKTKKGGWSKVQAMPAAELVHKVHTVEEDIPPSCKDCPTLNSCFGSAVWDTYKGNPSCPNRGIEDMKTIEQPKAGPPTGEELKEQLEQTVQLKGTEGKAEEPYLGEPISPELMALAKEKAGTRAEVVDLNTFTGKYERLEYMEGRIDNPDECQTCIHGFHYAFDSRWGEGGRAVEICTDTKCLTQKRAAYTRAKHVAGMKKKKAEATAIKEAVEATATIDKPRMKVIIRAQMLGKHTSSYYSSEKSPTKWLWERLNLPQAETHTFDSQKIMAAVDKLNEVDLAKLVVEFMLEMQKSTGDIERYKITTTEPLQWLGFTPVIDGKAVKEGADG